MIGNEYDIKYWENKIKKVVKLAREYGYDVYDTDFWNEQPSGVISLIIDLDKELNKYI